MRRLIIPVFLPGLGCPHRCIFCDQRAITGAPGRLPTAGEIGQVAAVYLGSAKAKRRLRQLAFYGGTFTLLPRTDQERLLEVGRTYIERGQIDSLRLSTRPDALDEACLVRLRGYGVRTIELGAQSFDDAVLGAARRGHTAADTRAASGLVRRFRLELGLQLMCGLPGETRESFLASCRTAASLAPDFVRLYPLLVLEATPLATLWRQGRYQPLSLDEAVERCRLAAEIFAARAIPVIRAGLPPSADLERALLAGPYHAAFGQLVRSAAWLERLRHRLAPHAPEGVVLEVAPQDISDVCGQNGTNLRRLAEGLGLAAVTAAASPRVPPGDVRIRRA